MQANVRYTEAHFVVWQEGQSRSRQIPYSMRDSLSPNQPLLKLVTIAFVSLESAGYFSKR
jgi:hypothetical protein